MGDFEREISGFVLGLFIQKLVVRPTCVPSCYKSGGIYFSSRFQRWCDCYWSERGHLFAVTQVDAVH